MGRVRAARARRPGHHRVRRADHDLPPDYTTESHDEADTGQQELYVALRGAGAVVVGDERLPLDPEHLVRVDAGVGRVLASGPEGLRVLCIGAVPGAPYEPPAWTAGVDG